MMSSGPLPETPAAGWRTQSLTCRLAGCLKVKVPSLLVYQTHPAVRSVVGDAGGGAATDTDADAEFAVAPTDPAADGVGVVDPHAATATSAAIASGGEQ